MKILYINILLVFIFQQAFSVAINQNLLIEKYGYNIDSVIIDLSEKSIDMIDVNTFLGYNSLEILLLQENKLKQLEQGLLNHLLNLKELWLESNIIVSVDRNVFVGLHKLEKVCLNDNPISLMFPSNIKSLCDTNPLCTIKINEKCTKDIQSTTTWSTKTASTNLSITGNVIKILNITGWARSLSVLPDGTLVAGSGNSITIWDPVKGIEIKTLTGHTSIVTSLAILPDGSLASGSFDTKIKIWDTVKGVEVKTLSGHSNYVHCLAVLLDGTLASSSSDYTIKIWNIVKGNLIKSLNQGPYDTMAPTFLAALPDGTLASASNYPFARQIKIWDTAKGSIIKNLIGHTKELTSLAVLPDGNLVSGSWDFTIRIWDTIKGSLINTLNGHNSSIQSLAVLSDGTLASASRDKSIKIWDTTKGSQIKTLNDHNSEVGFLAVLPDGTLVSASYQAIFIWE